MNHQLYSVRDDNWDADLNGLVSLLVDRFGFTKSDQKVELPIPGLHIKALTPAELNQELRSLPGWDPVESLMPNDYPKPRQELRKAYMFDSFEEAVRFLGAAAGHVSHANHHPRWENLWRSVTVYLSTWDIGFHISQLDVQLARILDRVYADFIHRPSKSDAKSKVGQEGYAP